MGIEIDQTTLTFTMGKPPYELGLSTVTSDAPMTPGQAAYEQFCEDVVALPPWEKVTESRKLTWERAAQAAINQFLDAHTCGADPAEPKCMNCP